MMEATRELDIRDVCGVLDDKGKNDGKAKIITPNRLVCLVCGVLIYF